MVDVGPGVLLLREAGDTLGAALARLILTTKSIPWKREDEWQRERAPASPGAPLDDALEGQRPVIGAAEVALCIDPDALDPNRWDSGPWIVGIGAICEHLEERYRRVPLLPTDARDRAFVRRTLDLCRPVLTMPRRPPGQLGPAPPAEDEAEARHLEGLCATLAELELLLDERRSFGAYGVGHSATLTDLLVVVLGRALRMRGGQLTLYPSVQRIFASMGQLNAVEQAYSRRAGALTSDLRPELRDRYIARFHEVVEPIAARMRLLESIAWPRALEEQFFAGGAGSLPRVEYAPDRQGALEAIDALEGLLRELVADHVLVEWLRAQIHSLVDGFRMLLGVGTRDFYALSLELYGGARTTAFDRNTTNLDLAEHVETRIGRETRFVETDALDTEAFVAFFEEKLAARRPHLELKITRDPALGAKVICGRTRLRVREGATFGREEAEGLWLHEVETHALTAQNGAAQRHFPLLRTGGPRSTRTQEGLAVFAELYGHAMSSPRLARIAQRVRLVGMAEDGASFLDLYRHLVERGARPRDAYQDAARICRGGLVEGGAPFTKDACYLAGLVDVYGLLRRTLRFRSPLLGELIVSGRIHSNDLVPLLWLRDQGLLAPPSYVPSWVERWDGLLSYFAFTSFLNEIDAGDTLEPSSELSELFERVSSRYDEGRTSPAALAQNE